MTIVLVSDNKSELKLLEENVALYYPGDYVISFLDPSEAEKYAKDHMVDVCYTAVVMKKTSGIAIAKEIKKVNPEVLINFIADDEQYALEGWKLHINDYIIRPVNAEGIAHTIREF